MTHDVFISHRGADELTRTNIKKTFVSFLHARLKQAGVTSFLDELSLQPGDAAEQVMLDAVRQCKIAIPVLTEGYGNSEWCLRELAIMVEAPGVVVMPLFLDEDGLAVLNKIRAASLRLSAQARPGELASWQRAIETAASSTGWRQDQTNG